jgi:hypothetical protein
VHGKERKPKQQKVAKEFLDIPFTSVFKLRTPAPF